MEKKKERKLRRKNNRVRVELLRSDQGFACFRKRAEQFAEANFPSFERVRNLEKRGMVNL